MRSVVIPSGCETVAWLELQSRWTQRLELRVMGSGLGQWCVCSVPGELV